MSEATDNLGPPPATPGTRTFGLALLLVSLSVLFLAAMVGYVIIRRRTDMLPVVLPFGLWLSTFVIFASSAVLHFATLSARAGRGGALRVGLLATLILGAAFLCLQMPSLIALAQAHRAAAEENIYLYSLVVILIILHGLHVVGGLIPMSITTVAAQQGRYDGGNYHPVRLVAMYWHFLAIVWLILFSLLLLLG